MVFGQLSNRENMRDLVVALEAHQPKCYYMGIDSKPITKTMLTRVNQNRGHWIFEAFAFYMVTQAWNKWVMDILKLNGNVYAFDSTTIRLCLAVLGQVQKMESRREDLFPLRFGETSVLVFFHITKASVHDSKVMHENPYETGLYYVFDCGYNVFKELFKIYKGGRFFIVRAKKNLQVHQMASTNAEKCAH